MFEVYKVLNQQFNQNYYFVKNAKSCLYFNFITHSYLHVYYVCIDLVLSRTMVLNVCTKKDSLCKKYFFCLFQF